MSADVTAMPPWLDEMSLRAMQAEQRRQRAWGRDSFAARAAVRDVLLALRPGLPFTLLDEATSLVVPDAEGTTNTMPPREDGLVPATQQEVAETLSYALRFNLDGKPRRTGHEHLAPLAAAQLAQHLLRSNYRILRASSATRLHGQGW